MREGAAVGLAGAAVGLTGAAVGLTGAADGLGVGAIVSGSSIITTMGDAVGEGDGLLASGSTIGSFEITKVWQSLSLNTQPFSASTLYKLP